MVSRAINDRFDSWYLKDLNFPRPKDSGNYDAPELLLLNYHLSLIAFETMRLLARKNNINFRL